MKLEPIIEMPCMVSALWRRFAVHVFEGKVTLDDMDRIEANSEVWHAKVTGKLVEMVVIVPSEAKMTSEERARMTRIIKRWESKRLASATVILATGLVGAMHRSVLTGMQMIVPAPHPVKVFGTVREAIGWLRPHVDKACGASAGEHESVSPWMLCVIASLAGFEYKARAVSFRFRVLLIAAASCTHDVVLPSPTSGDTCGDGVVGPSEDCDTQSAGCTDCKVTPGWQCIDNSCFYPCGDGISGTNPGASCDGTVKDTACDMTGWWLSRENDSIRDAVLNQPQPASTWYLYRFSQNNGVFQVEQAIHCGFHVTGSAVVDCTPGTLRGLLYRNDPSINGAHPRRGTFQAQGGACSFSLDRFYRIRGGTTVLVPTDFSQHPPLSALIPLPYEVDPLHPTGEHIENQEDTDLDGFPGAAFRITGLASGVREATQRDFKEYATSSTEMVPQNAVQFTVHGDWDLQETVLSARECGADADGGEGLCPLIITPGHTDPATLIPRVTLRYLGSALQSQATDGFSRVGSVVLGNPGDNPDVDLATCANVRIALPHDPNP